MKIGLYIEHGVGNGVGGAELMMAYLAGAWSADHDVDLVHHRPPLTRERIASFSKDNYDRVNVRYVPREADPPAYGNPLKRYRAARENPALNVFRTLGEKIWVSCKLATWARRLTYEPKRGSASGMMLLPSSMV